MLATLLWNYGLWKIIKLRSKYWNRFSFWLQHTNTAILHGIAIRIFHSSIKGGCVIDPTWPVLSLFNQSSILPFFGNYQENYFGQFRLNLYYFYNVINMIVNPPNIVVIMYALHKLITYIWENMVFIDL